MKMCSPIFFWALSLLSACAATGTTGVLPDEVVAMAAPNQNLASARVLPEDGCYWYTHQGPVETTLLPLRTKEGRPICTKPQSE